MKHFSSLDSVAVRALALSSEENIKISGFHPDIFKPLIRLLNCRLFIVVSDVSFNVVTKHLSSFWGDDSVVFIGGSSRSSSPCARRRPPPLPGPEASSSPLRRGAGR